MRWITHLRVPFTLVGMICLLSSSAALAEEGLAEGRVWLTRTTVVGASGMSGTLATDEVDDLATVGGALLVSGQAHALCTVAIRVGTEEHYATFSAQPEVRYVPLDNVGPGAVEWSLVGQGCRVDVEGAMLFVGDAAAYVGETPDLTWQDLRGATAPGVR